MSTCKHKILQVQGLRVSSTQHRKLRGGPTPPAPRRALLLLFCNPLFCLSLSRTRTRFLARNCSDLHELVLACGLRWKRFLSVCIAPTNVPRVYRAQGDDTTMLRACLGSQITRQTRAQGDDITMPRAFVGSQITRQTSVHTHTLARTDVRH